MLLTQMVGYYWNDRLKDSVFVLPKVFLEPDASKQDLVFGKYKPEDVIDVANQKFTKAERDFIYGFAVWIYRALSVFKADNPKGQDVDTSKEMTWANVVRNYRPR